MELTSFRNLAIAYYDTGELALAIENNEAALQLNPNDLQTNNNLGYIHAELAAIRGSDSLLAISLCA